MLLHQPAALRVHQHSRSSNIHAPKFARSPCLKQNPCCSAWFQKQSVVMPQVLRQQASRPAKTSHLSASSRDDLNPVEVVKREAALASNRWVLPPRVSLVHVHFECLKRHCDHHQGSAAPMKVQWVSSARTSSGRSRRQWFPCGVSLRFMGILCLRHTHITQKHTTFNSLSFPTPSDQT